MNAHAQTKEHALMLKALVCMSVIVVHVYLYVRVCVVVYMYDIWHILTDSHICMYYVNIYIGHITTYHCDQQDGRNGSALQQGAI